MFYHRIEVFLISYIAHQLHLELYLLLKYLNQILLTMFLLLYYSFEKDVLERQEIEIQKEIQEIDRKYKEGKLRMYYKPNIHPRVKEYMNKLIVKGK